MIELNKLKPNSNQNMYTTGLPYIFESTKGRRRQENQDNILVVGTPAFDIFAVFDGVGSAKHGKIATDIAKETIENAYEQFVVNDELDLSKLMFHCHTRMLSHPLDELYTTYSLVVIYRNSPQLVTYSSLGDTRIYFVTKQYIEQISEDDRMFTSKNVISKCLGLDFLEQDDFSQRTVEKENRSILICSDGFYDLLENDRMSFFVLLNNDNIKRTARGLNHAIEGNNSDDATYIFIK